ncbi:MAG TPA: MFS transporter, partial [Arthrobacter sp.]|nr:MFS transporter [Arthrobacter sp.]
MPRLPLLRRPAAPGPVRRDPAGGSLAVWPGHPKGSAAYRKILAGLAFAGVATFAQLYSTQAVLPMMAAELQVTAAEAALTISLATVGLAVTVLPWSFLADRIGRVRAMMWGISAATVLGLAVPLASSFPMLLGLRMLEGMALGGIPAIAIAYLNEEVNKAHAALAAGTYVAGTTLGGLAGRLLAGFVGELWGWRAAALSVSILAAVAAALFLVLVPQARGFTAAAAGGFRGAFRTLAGHGRNPRLLALYVQAFLLMGGFVAVYNYLGFRLTGEPFSLPATIISLIFLAYLSGTVSSRWAGGLAARFGRRTVMIAGTVLMVAGLALTLTPLLPLIMAGLLLFTGGFFAAHSIGAGWTGVIATTGRAQAASLYN